MKTQKFGSTNGRYGVEVCYSDEIESWSPVMRGTLTSLGTTAGYECFEFVPGEGDEFVITGEDLRPIEGCVTIVNMGLQGEGNITLLAAVNGALWKAVRHSGRSKSYEGLKDGAIEKVPRSVLLALGLVEPDKAPRETPKPPALSGTLASALKKAGW